MPDALDPLTTLGHLVIAHLAGEVTPEEFTEVGRDLGYLTEAAP